MGGGGGGGGLCAFILRGCEAERRILVGVYLSPPQHITSTTQVTLRYTVFSCSMCSGVAALVF